MKCLHPNIINGVRYPCGKCEACTCNKTNEYILRFMATARHTHAYFITLTYADEFLPRYGVCKLDVRKFLDNLKNKIGKFKYVAISEYGGRFCRPHYHLNIFASEEIKNPFGTIESCWSMGRTQVKKHQDKELNYIAKYHATEILSRNIFQYGDYPSYIRLSDCRDAEDMYKKMSQRLNVPVASVTAELHQCTEPFRMTSRGIGIERLSEDNFKQNVREGKFYEINNKKRRSSMPRYYKSQLSFEDRLRSDEAQVDYLFDREPNETDIMAQKCDDYELANKHYQEKWRKNYEESVIKRKKHSQSTY